MTVPVQVLRERLSYDAGTGLLFWRMRANAIPGWNTKYAGKQAFTHISKHGYCVTNLRVGGRSVTISAHRAAWAIHYGEWPSGQIDHVNGVRTDNRLVNLRDVVNAENAMNMAMKANNTSGVNGVYRHRQTGKWCAQISAFGKTVGLGLFAEKEHALIARKAAERALGYHPNHGRSS
ncbi:HNH endonuclease signature motif containing protein [Rhodovulum sulfidophilum]|uniref:HNH endonuclease signature motif containing protein n=1 Tax=Rhodovulum sulfidophilum TaxID=35806 RepID=UPI0013897963|nr:HNH endonuclease signature motif containing protein [Rhodovulum sulfidophilum]NDK37109.1 HNH endonuclease [Rhodovulum sulfidophilum]